MGTREPAPVDDREEPGSVPIEKWSTPPADPSPAARGGDAGHSELLTVLAELTAVVERLGTATDRLVSLMESHAAPQPEQDAAAVAPTAATASTRRTRLQRGLPHLVLGLLTAGIAVTLTLYLFVR